MLRRAAALILLVAGPALAYGQEQPKDAGTKESLILKLFRFPPGLFEKQDTLPVTFQSKKNPLANHYDVREFIEKCGLPLPPGASAIYRPYLGQLLMFNTAENLEMADYVFTLCGIYFSRNIVTEIQTFECDLPREDFASIPSYAELEKLPPSAIRLLDHAPILSKPALTSETRRTTPSKALAPGKPLTRSVQERLEESRRFADDETGTIVGISPELGPDGQSLSTAIYYRFKMPSDAGASSEFRFIGTFDSKANQPVVIYSAPISGSDGKTLVVVAKTRQLSPDGTDFTFNPSPMTETFTSP